MAFATKLVLDLDSRGLTCVRGEKATGPCRWCTRGSTEHLKLQDGMHGPLLLVQGPTLEATARMALMVRAGSAGRGSRLKWVTHAATKPV